MAQRAIIGINGNLIPFDETLDKLQTQGIGGGSVTWVPDADTRCTALTVTANGSKSASDEGVYGWNYVAVSVPGSSVTGIDPATGQKTTVTVDPETGDIVKTVVPTEIRVTTLPTKTDYTNGETIDYSGIVVHAYSSTGQDIGAVPFGELVFPFATAQGEDEWSDGQGLNAMMLYYTPTWTRTISSSSGEQEIQVFCSTSPLGTYQGAPATYGANGGPGTLLFTRYNGENYAASVAGNRRADIYCHYDGPSFAPGYEVYGWIGRASSSADAGINKFARMSFAEYIIDIPESTVAPTTVDPATLHATQTLPVQWQRPGDGAILETSFIININVTGGNT